MNCDFYNLAPINIDGNNLHMWWSVWGRKLTDNFIKLTLFDSRTMQTERESPDK